MADGNLEQLPVPSDSQDKVVSPFQPFKAVNRFLLRILLFYWICFTFPFPLDLIGLPLGIVDPEGQPPWFQPVSESYKKAFAWVKPVNEEYGKPFTWIYEKKTEACKWVGKEVLHVEVITQMTGSGDTMRAYVGCFCAGVIAVGLAILWSVLAWLVRRWKPAWCPDGLLYRLVCVLVRFFLCGMLFGYGFAKVFPMQFAPPGAFRLTQQLGDMSPMGLLWTFMGFSTAYQMFTGWVEVAAGLLLVARRTSLLGALLASLAMGQVFMLNMCFDVPVKLYSLHYLVMSVFLLVPDLGRLTSVLVLGRAVPAKVFPPMLGRVGVDRTALVLRSLLVVMMLYTQVGSVSQRWMQTYGGEPAPVSGRWDMVSLKIDGKAVTKEDPAFWAWLDFGNKGLVRVGLPNGQPKMVVYRLGWVPEKNQVAWTRFVPPKPPVTVDYNLSEADKLEVKGTFDGKVISATLKPAPEKQYELMNRGFHWIQEFPYNR
ncbi:hypothetical protein BH10PLA2_BH10PLA2_04660 [soil metagenome]